MPPRHWHPTLIFKYICFFIFHTDITHTFLYLYTSHLGSYNGIGACMWIWVLHLRWQEGVVLEMYLSYKSIQVFLSTQFAILWCLYCCCHKAITFSNWRFVLRNWPLLGYWEDKIEKREAKNSSALVARVAHMLLVDHFKVQEPVGTCSSTFVLIFRISSWEEVCQNKGMWIRNSYEAS